VSKIKRNIWGDEVLNVSEDYKLTIEDYRSTCGKWCLTLQERSTGLCLCLYDVKRPSLKAITENLMIEEVRDRLINQGVEWEKVYKPVQSISKWLEDAYM
jgi:hypothetical protein